MRYRVLARLRPFGPLAEQAEARFANSDRAEAYAVSLMDEGYGLVTILDGDEVLVQWKNGEEVLAEAVRNPLTGVPLR